MRLQRFLEERSPAWDELEALLRRAGSRPERLEAHELLRLGALYRAAAADLSLARRAFPHDPVTARLERLVLRGRSAVYSERDRASALGFLATGYWRLVIERRRALGMAALLLFAPMALAAWWALEDPFAALGVVPGEFQPSGEPGEGLGSLSTEDQAGLSSQIFTNNIQVSFLAFAGGILGGIGTAAALIYNGGFIGALGAIVGQAGHVGEFFELVTPHGVLELSCIVVTAAMGLRIGWALIDPGLLTRGDSLRREARPAMAVVLGTIPWFVLAGLVEGFVTGSLGGLAEAIAVGVSLGALYWGLVVWRGVRAEPAP